MNGNAAVRRIINQLKTLYVFTTLCDSTLTSAFVSIGNGSAKLWRHARTRNRFIKIVERAAAVIECVQVLAQSRPMAMLTHAKTIMTHR